MTKREYLRSLGFEVGERGRFTDAMKSALAKYKGTFDEPASSASANRTQINFIPMSQTVVRDKRILIGYTREGYSVGFESCRQCAQHMIYCNCHGGILAPSVVVRSNEPDVRVA